MTTTQQTRGRVYVPITVAGLERLVDGGSLGPGLAAFAVTDELALWWADGTSEPLEPEELEYAATVQAAATSLALLDPGGVAAGTEPARRVVLAAEVSGVGPPDEVAPGAVTVTEEMALSDVVSVHIDTADAAGAVRAAVAALADDAAPDSHVELVLGEMVDHELAWYAPHEAADLLARLLR